MLWQHFGKTFCNRIGIGSYFNFKEPGETVLLKSISKFHSIPSHFLLSVQSITTIDGTASSSTNLKNVSVPPRPRLRSLDTFRG